MPIKPTKFITAPSRIPDERNRQSILIIDASWHDIELLVLASITQDFDVDFYIFGPTSPLSEWLDDVLVFANTILINEDSSRLTMNNGEVIQDPRTTIFGKTKPIATPLEYMVTMRQTTRDT